MIKLNLLITILCVIGVECQAAEPATQPSEVTTADRFVELITSCQSMRKLPQADAQVKTAMDRVYRDAWLAAFDFACASKDSQAQLVLQRAWDSAWEKSDDTSALSAALAEKPGCRIFMTDKVLSTWRTANDDKTIRSMAYWVYLSDNDDDAKYIKAKISSLSDPHKQQILADGISWRRYRLNGNSPGPGPACPQPFPGE